MTIGHRGPVLVTGGAGFIGSAVVRRLVSEGTPVVNVDALTYAGNLGTLAAVQHSANYCFEHVDICDFDAVSAVFERHRPSSVMHLAAESHVDRSIDGPDAFVRTNVIGTFNLLQAARRHLTAASSEQRHTFRFLHVSTDEVFGTLGDTGLFDEASAYSPRSPYSASKAASDHFARAWFHTFNVPVIVTNCSNNYGPYQLPEKLIPLIIRRGMLGEPMPVYGNGLNVRDWIFVDDHVDGLLAALASGVPGATYLFGGEAERRNIDVVKEVCRSLDALLPEGAPHEKLITFVEDRPGHDFRYAVDTTSARHRLPWSPSHAFGDGIRATVQWYVAHNDWVEAAVTGKQIDGRLGLPAEQARGGET